MDHAGLLLRIERAWTEFTDSYAGLSDAELLEVGVTGDWSVRDIIAHVSWWEHEALTHLPEIVAGRRPPRYADAYGGIDAFNALRTSQWSELSLVEVLERQGRTHLRLLDFVRAAPEDAIRSETRFRRRLRLDTYGHYPLHARAIRAWRGRRDARSVAT